MSRSATALAYREPRTTQRATQRRARPDGYRLLGGTDVQLPYAVVARGHRPVMNHAARGTSMASGPRVWVWCPARLPAPAIELSTKRWIIQHPQWLFGTLICVVALLAVSPALASGRVSSRSRSLTPVGIAGPAGVASSSQSGKPQGQAQAASSKPEPVGRRYELLGAPSLSVGQIEAVLSQYGSPAAGNGQALYDLGVRYGIDPAYALAFFVHESGCGTRGVARFTHSLGNIRWTDGYDNLTSGLVLDDEAMRFVTGQ